METRQCHNSKKVSQTEFRKHFFKYEKYDLINTKRQHYTEKILRRDSLNDSKVVL